MLVGSAAVAVGAVAGCRQKLETSEEAISERRDVPLRIALVGDDRDAESIRRGWSAVTEQPITIEVIELNRADAGTLAALLLAAAKNSDLLIYPLALVADLMIAESIVALSSNEFAEIEDASGSLFPALRNAARYSDEYFAMPLGAPLPALLSVDGAVTVASWEEYDHLVQREWSGMAAEPSAPGWAAAMFLWRMAESKNWLFSRKGLVPLVDSEPYTAALDLMVRTHSRYKSKHQTPGQVWSAVESGELRGGIGFPQTLIDAGSEMHLANLPAARETSKVLPDPFSPVISLSFNCRQSAVAKRFVQWISGGVGSDSVRQRVTGMTVTRRTNSKNATADSISAGTGSYDTWLAARLSSPITMPTLQILQGGDYYAALDSQVIRALEGDATPEQALAEVARRWQATTEKVGLDKQLRAWRRA
jgi:hypothetical protein